MRFLPVCVVTFSVCALAQAPETGGQAQTGTPASSAGARLPDPDPKPYDKVASLRIRFVIGPFPIPPGPVSTSVLLIISFPPFSGS